jgi:hypothetical protein
LSQIKEDFIHVSDKELLDQEMEKAVSNFCKVQKVGQAAPRGDRFLLGPIFSKDQKHCDLFAPTIHIKGEGTFKMLVFHTQKLLVTVLVKEAYQFTYSFLHSLEVAIKEEFAHVAKTLDVQLDTVLKASTQQSSNSNQQTRYFYANEMNLALKFSGQLNKDIFNQDLKLNINQMHQRF